MGRGGFFFLRRAGGYRDIVELLGYGFCKASSTFLKFDLVSVYFDDLAALDEVTFVDDFAGDNRGWIFVIVHYAGDGDFG